MKEKEDMNIVIVGHVDHGKSTLMGRLLADTDSLPQGKLEQVKETCRRNSKPFEYAFLLDALKDEQAQGITIDTARCFFKTEKRDYIILDAPGHIEFLKNMITGASRAQAALLIIDAKEGVQENSRRHGYMLSMLGIKQIAVVINKMDLVDYKQEIFDKVKEEYLNFLKQIDVKPKFVLPISAFEGENVVKTSKSMPWYHGKNILQVLDGFECEKDEEDQTFRMPVQDIYKFTRNGDDRRIVAGSIETGKIKEGDEVVFYPSGKRSHIKSVEVFNKESTKEASAGNAAGFTLVEQIYIRRGEVMTNALEQKPKVASRILVNLFWLGKKNLVANKTYYLKIGCQKVRVVLERINQVMNSSNLSSTQKHSIARNEVAECILKTERPIAFDLVSEIAGTSRFVVVDDYEIAGGGIITKALEDDQSMIRDKTILRNYKWEVSDINRELRFEHYAQRPTLILLTGERGVGKKTLAKRLEKNLLDSGRFVYYMGIGTYLYSVGADIKLTTEENQEEQIKRFAEVANLMMDAGMILIVTARSLSQKDIDIMETVIQGDIETIWVGENITTNIKVGVHIEEVSEKDNILLLKEYLKEKGIIFRA